MYIIFSTLVLIIILYYFGKNKRRRHLANKLPGPKGLPIIGYSKLWNLSPAELLSHLIELQKIYKGFYQMWVGNECWIVIYEPKLVERILNNERFVKANDYEFLKCWLGTGLLTSEGKKWFARRKAITPAFHFKILNEFIEIFVKQTDIMLDKFNTSESLDVYPLLLLCALDIICETAMGIQINAQTNISSTYAKAVKDISDIMYKRMFNPLLASNIIFWCSKYYNIQKESLKIINSMTQNVISERRLNLQKIDNDESNQDEFGIRKKMALLDILLKTTIDGQQLSDEDIQEEVNTFMFAGHDTTGTTLGFLFYNIAKYSEVQKKLINEISDIIGINKITISNLNELKYLDLVLKESMRIHTTVPFIGRQILEEYQYDDIIFPTNTNASICVYSMCHNKDIFHDPEEFIPERFDKTLDNEKMHPFSYIPFSAGPRNCVGQKFATLEMKTIIVKTLQKYEIFLANPNEELILAAGMVLKSENGIKLKFKPRDI